MHVILRGHLRLATALPAMAICSINDNTPQLLRIYVYLPVLTFLPASIWILLFALGVPLSVSCWYFNLSFPAPAHLFRPLFLDRSPLISSNSKELPSRTHPAHYPHPYPPTPTIPVHFSDVRARGRYTTDPQNAEMRQSGKWRKQGYRGEWR